MYYQLNVWIIKLSGLRNILNDCNNFERMETPSIKNYHNLRTW